MSTASTIHAAWRNTLQSAPANPEQITVHGRASGAPPPRTVPRAMGHYASRTSLVGLTALVLALSAGAGAADANRGQGGTPGGSKQPEKGVVNINTASEEQLELLPGIGPSKASAICRYRGKRRFSATHQLVRVRGIGRKTYRRLRGYLTVTGPTTLTRKPVKQRR